jgi:D-alanyl-D-alanine carboxypeptidase/D-alanyl-D-alanine-endopeptidase (penicillin-binding protein 4)
MLPSRRWLAPVSSLAWLVAAAVGQARELERAIAAAEALGARTGVAVVDADASVLHRHHATDAFAPASNMKLLTAAAVLQGLGAEHQWCTRFVLRAGRLVVVASGDPNWITGTSHAPEAVFAAVAAALQQRGVTELLGIDLDAGTFTGPMRPPTWPQDQLHTYYCAPTGPFVLDQGTFALHLAAGSDGAATVRLVAPLAQVPLQGRVELVDRQRGATYGAIDGAGGVQVRGKFWRKSPPVTIRTAVADPGAWYLATLRTALQRAGIRVGTAAVADAVAGDVVVHEHRSDLAAALLRMLEDSSNFDAEQCLRTLGAKTAGDGSLAGGTAAMARVLRDWLGVLPDGVVLVDGSGLSKQNRLTPGLLVAAMFAAAGRPGGRLLHECLPVAGQSGTLAERFRGSDLVGRVRAKTGWIRGASALSGAVERRDGRQRWFAILMNYDPKANGLNQDLKQLQERIVAAIDRLEAAR